MYDGILAYGGPKKFGLIASLYFIILFICGNYILLNVFLAIAVDNLAGGDEDEVDKDENGNDGDGEPEETEAEKEIREIMARREAAAIRGSLEHDDNGERDANGTAKTGNPFMSESNDGNGQKGLFHIAEALIPKADFLTEDEIRGKDKDESSLPSDEYHYKYFDDDDEGEFMDPLPPDPDDDDDDLNKILPIPPYSSLFIFSPENKFRVFCHWFCNHSVFSNFILVCIMVSSASLAAEDPLNSKSPRNVILGYLDIFFTTIFTIEIIVKVISYGVIFHPNAYMRFPANILDILVVSVSLISFSFSSEGGAISVLKILRVLRVLRPLRAINRAKGLKLVIQAVIVSVSTIQNIVMVTVLLMFLFAVIGVQLFKGKFYSCTDSAKSTEEECQGTFIDYEESDLSRPIVREREWERYDFHYDNVPKGMLSLFVVSTFEGWPGYEQSGFFLET